MPALTCKRSQCGLPSGLTRGAGVDTQEVPMWFAIGFERPQLDGLSIAVLTLLADSLFAMLGYEDYFDMLPVFIE